MRLDATSWRIYPSQRQIALNADLLNRAGRFSVL